MRFLPRSGSRPKDLGIRRRRIGRKPAFEALEERQLLSEATTVGIYRPSTSWFYLRNSNSTGNVDASFVYGDPGDVAVVGDWDGDGGATVGIYRPSTSWFYLRNSNS